MSLKKKRTFFNGKIPLLNVFKSCFFFLGKRRFGSQRGVGKGKDSIEEYSVKVFFLRKIFFAEWDFYIPLNMTRL